MNNNNLSRNRSSINTRFAIRFLRALKKINKPTNSSSVSDKTKRFHVIRAAAYASMASAVGPRRAWSRAVLWKIRNLTLHRALMKKTRTHSTITKRKGNPRCNNNLGSEKVNDLRGLVPGGEGMDYFELLQETAHYIKCLKAKVQVMTNIVDHCSK